MFFVCKNKNHSSCLAFPPFSIETNNIWETKSVSFLLTGFLIPCRCICLPWRSGLENLPSSDLLLMTYSCNFLYPQDVCPQCQTACYWYFLSVNVLFIFLWVHQCLRLLFLLFPRIIELSEAICAQILQRVQVKYSIQIYYRKNSSCI